MSTSQEGGEGAPAADFMQEFARAAGDIHRTLLDGKHDFSLRNFQAADYYLSRLVDLGVISESESERLAEMIGGTSGTEASPEDGRVQDVGHEIRNDDDASPVAIAIAGVVADSVASAELRSVAGADALGALVGGVAGAVAGEMVGGPEGAVAGGCFGAVFVGVVASWQEAHPHE